MRERLSNLLSVKSLITLAMTAALLLLLFGRAEPPQEALALYCTSYGAIINRLFTRKDGGGNG